MMDLKTVKERFENLLKLKNEICLETVQVILDEEDLKSIIYYLGELYALLESEEEP